MRHLNAVFYITFGFFIMGNYEISFQFWTLNYVMSRWYLVNGLLYSIGFK